MNNNLLKKILTYKQRPDIAKALTVEELTTAFADLFAIVKATNQAIEDGKVKGKDGYTPQADKDYLSLKTAEVALRSLFEDANGRVDVAVQDGLDTIAKKLAEVRDGIDAVITDDQIEEAAKRAALLIDMPDFGSLITAEPTAIRNALELLQGDDRIELAAIKGWEEELNRLRDDVRMASQGGGGLGRGQVISLIQQYGSGVSDGDKGDVTVTGNSWTLNDDTVGQAELDTTGTPNGSKFLRDDMSWQSIPGGGDMLASVYDPTSVAGDAFDMDNMVEGTNNLILTADERAKIGNGKMLSSTDLNTITTGGRYGVIGALNTNTPKAGEFALEVYNDGSRVFQIATYTDNSIHSRVYNGSWGAWSTQTAANISDFDTEVSNNTDVTANTSARHTHSNQTTLDNITAAYTTAEASKLAGIEAGADVTDATNVSAAGASIISSGAGAPSSTPTKVGDIYIDTTGDDAYIAVGTASSADWEKSNDGAGGGNVSKVGTPVDNQIGVWTGDGTIEGDTGLTFDTATDTLTAGLIVQSSGNNDLTLRTGNATTGSITIVDGANGNINITPNGTGKVYIPKDVEIDNGNLYLTIGNIVANSGNGIIDNNLNEQLLFTTTEVAVNYFNIKNSATGNAPILSVAGNDTNIDLTLTPKGTGVVNLNGGAKIATLTGVLRADTGVVSVDTDVTDIVSAASDTAAGKVELATIAETNTGTDATRAVTPDGLAGSNFGVRYVAVSLNGSTALTTSDVAYFRIPAAFTGMNLVSVAASVGTGAAGASSSGTPTFTVKNVTDAQQMLSTNLTVDANEYTSATAATAAVINTAYDDVVTDDMIEVACTIAGTGTTYATITLGFALP